MTYKKNDIVTLRITDMSSDGAGIGKADGFTLFVKDTVIGDEALVKIIKVKKNYGFGRLVELITPSPDRVEAPCPIARACGGCQLQMMAYRKQLEFKASKVKNDLVRIGGFDPVQIEAVTEPIIGMENPFRYRNKAQFPIGKDKEGRLIAGFYAGRTHSVIECEDCLLGAKENKEILAAILAWMEECHLASYDEKDGRGLIRHVLIRHGEATGERMICLVINAPKLPEDAEEKLIARLHVPGLTSLSYSVNTERNNVIMGREVHTILGSDHITDRIGSLSFEISPLSFYQVNPSQTLKLYEKALEYADLKGGETVWDLYCGIGTISLFLAQKAAKVYGVEMIPQAVEDAQKNATRNQIRNASFLCGKAEEIVPQWVEEKNASADVIVVDPPRKGCDEALLRTILRVAPDKVVYVSCDPASLARDLKVLCNGGYRLCRVTSVDQFGQTVHVESVALLRR